MPGKSNFSDWYSWSRIHICSMKLNCVFQAVSCFGLTLSPFTLMSQTNDSAAAHWLAKAPPIPAFNAPASKSAWEKERKQIRATALDLLGKLPPRPKVPGVKIVWRED